MSSANATNDAEAKFVIVVSLTQLRAPKVKDSFGYISIFE
jgi:hypothetical protein